MRQVLDSAQLISIHVPLARDDPHPCAAPERRRNFNPRPSCEGRRKLTEGVIPTGKFQSTSLLRGTTACNPLRPPQRVISIHVPLARDDAGQAYKRETAAISIHVPLARDDLVLAARHKQGKLNFNPRPSCEGRRGQHEDGRGTTSIVQHFAFAMYDFNPRPSCEGRHHGRGVRVFL